MGATKFTLLLWILHIIPTLDFISLPNYKGRSDFCLFLFFLSTFQLYIHLNNLTNRKKHNKIKTTITTVYPLISHPLKDLSNLLISLPLNHFLVIKPVYQKLSKSLLLASCYRVLGCWILPFPFTPFLDHNIHLSITCTVLQEILI